MRTVGREAPVRLQTAANGSAAAKQVDQDIKSFQNARNIFVNCIKVRSPAFTHLDACKSSLPPEVRCTNFTAPTQKAEAPHAVELRLLVGSHQGAGAVSAHVTARM